MQKIIANTINEYIAHFPEPVQQQLQLLKTYILTAAPNAVEKISYGMPAFYQHECLVYFAAYKNHIGFYPTASPIIAFKAELLPYKTSKGAIQFSINEALPANLIKEIVAYRIMQASEKAALKKISKRNKKP